jgi:DHA1 family multidrug resistance protein-like MFS transporter
MRASIALCISTAAVAFCNAPWEVFALRAVAGFFSGFSSAANALVATEVPQDRLGYSLGWLATAQLVGTLVGPLMGGLLADHLGHNYRVVFILTSVITLVAAAFCGAYIHESAETAGRRNAQVRRRRPLLEQFRELAQNPTLAPMFGVVLLAQVCAVGVVPVVPLFVRSLVDPNWVATAAASAVAATGVAGVIAAPWLGRLSDRIGSRRVLIGSILGAACCTFPQALATTLWGFVALRFGVGLFLGGIMPAANALIGRMVAPEERGRIFGIASSGSFLGMAIGPLLGSQVMAHFGFHAVFITISALMFCNVVWVAASVRERTYGEATAVPQ